MVLFILVEKIAGTVYLFCFRAKTAVFVCLITLRKRGFARNNKYSIEELKYYVNEIFGCLTCPRH